MSNSYDNVVEWDVEADPAERYSRRTASGLIASEARLQRNLRAGFDGDGTPVERAVWCGHWTFKGGSICVNCQPDRRQKYVSLAINRALSAWAEEF